jgi:hypothetical protein
MVAANPLAAHVKNPWASQGPSRIVKAKEICSRLSQTLRKSQILSGDAIGEWIISQVIATSYHPGQTMQMSGLLGLEVLIRAKRAMSLPPRKKIVTQLSELWLLSSEI